MFCCRKSVETSLALTQMFEAVILRELYPQSKIDIYVQVLQSDGGVCDGAETSCVRDMRVSRLGSMYIAMVKGCSISH